MEGIIEKSSSNHKLVLDNYCKLIICHEEILSRIVKCFIDEAKHLTLNEIERLIKEKKSFHHLDKENFIRESIQQFEDKNQRNYFLKRINNPRITEGIIGDRTFDKWFMFYLNLLYVE